MVYRPEKLGLPCPMAFYVQSILLKMNITVHITHCQPWRAHITQWELMPVVVCLYRSPIQMSPTIHGGQSWSWMRASRPHPSPHTLAPKYSIIFKTDLHCYIFHRYVAQQSHTDTHTHTLAIQEIRKILLFLNILALPLTLKHICGVLF